MRSPALRLPRSQADSTLLVAELSANHGGSLERALETVRAASACGADAVKIQTYTADTLTIDSERPEFRITDGPWAGYSLHQLYREAHTPWEWHPALTEAAASAGIPLFSTPFDATAVDFLEKLGVPAYKVASFELVDLELLEKVAATGKPVLLSTGMASFEEIGVAVAAIRRVWRTADPGLVLLHCVSAYPAPPEGMHLATIGRLAEEFDVVPGLSDHTLGTEVAATAVALGARVIEKHFTLSRALGGPDGHFSLEPAEFQRLTEGVRAVERTLGTVRDGPTAEERGNLLFRRSIFAVADIAAGEALTRENVRVIRPGHGLAPKHLPEVLGRRAARACPRGTPIQWDLLE